MNTQTKEMSHQKPIQNPPIALESPKTHQSLFSETDEPHNEETKIGTFCQGEEKKEETEKTELGIQENIVTGEDNGGRERLKRHRREVAGSVWIPEIWGQENLLKDWIDCSAFDSSLVPNGISTARAALVDEGRRANSGRLRVENSC